MSWGLFRKCFFFFFFFFFKSSSGHVIVSFLMKLFIKQMMKLSLLFVIERDCWTYQLIKRNRCQCLA